MNHSAIIIANQNDDLVLILWIVSQRYPQTTLTIRSLSRSIHNYLVRTACPAIEMSTFVKCDLNTLIVHTPNILTAIRTDGKSSFDRLSKMITRELLLYLINNDQHAIIWWTINTYILCYDLYGWKNMDMNVLLSKAPFNHNKLLYPDLEKL